MVSSGRVQDRYDVPKQTDKENLPYYGTISVMQKNALRIKID